jgi:hypothetical protein
MPSPKALVKRLPSQTMRRLGPYASERKRKAKVMLLGLSILDGGLRLFANTRPRVGSSSSNSAEPTASARASATSSR